MGTGVKNSYVQGLRKLNAHSHTYTPRTGRNDGKVNVSRVPSLWKKRRPGKIYKAPD